MHRWLVCAFVVSFCLLGTGCGARGPYAERGAQERDIHQAEVRYQEAMRETEPEAMERLLREALGLDLYHGPAHNNLGVLLMQRGNLYDAAEEFEWARKLMPGHPEPRVNLALALERGGQSNEAIRAAQAALEARPGHLNAVQALAWIQIRSGQTDEQTTAHLDAIVMRATNATWRAWAERWRLVLRQRAADG